MRTCRLCHPKHVQVSVLFLQPACLSDGRLTLSLYSCVLPCCAVLQSVKMAVAVGNTSFFVIFMTSTGELSGVCCCSARTLNQSRSLCAMLCVLLNAPRPREKSCFASPRHALLNTFTLALKSDDKASINTCDSWKLCQDLWLDLLHALLCPR